MRTWGIVVPKEGILMIFISWSQHEVTEITFMICKYLLLIILLFATYTLMEFDFCISSVVASDMH